MNLPQCWGDSATPLAKFFGPGGPRGKAFGWQAPSAQNQFSQVGANLNQDKKGVLTRRAVRLDQSAGACRKRAFSDTKNI
jgi:hypothetical protein